MDITAAKTRAAGELRESGVAEPIREAASLLAFVLGRDAAFLVAHPEYTLTVHESAAYTNAVNRRSGREPFQYITGRQEFYGLEFEVTPDVLIPRPETEVLVEDAIAIVSEADDPTFCEIGVGSGCISVAILNNVPRSQGMAVDVSPAAIAVAKRNANRHGVADRLTFIRGDVFDHSDGTFDLIVSNPPYIPDDQLDNLQAEVRQFEPQTALAGGASGLDIIERIIAGAPRHLASGGFLLIEIGFDQSERVERLFDRDVWAEVGFLEDLRSIPRIVRAQLAVR